MAGLAPASSSIGSTINLFPLYSIARVACRISRNRIRLFLTQSCHPERSRRTPFEPQSTISRRGILTVLSVQQTLLWPRQLYCSVSSRYHPRSAHIRPHTSPSPEFAASSQP